MISPATASTSSSTGPAASHVSRIPSYSGTASASSTPAWVSSRINARTRSGAVSATRSDRNPPWLIPPTTARSIPR